MKKLIPTLEKAFLDNNRDETLAVLNHAKKYLVDRDAINEFTDSYLNQINTMIANNDYESVIGYVMLLIEFMESLEYPESYKTYLIARYTLSYFVEDFETARIYVEKTLRMLEGSTDYFGIINCHNNLGEMVYEMGNFDDALDYFLAGECKCKEAEGLFCDDLRSKITINCIKGLVALRRLDEAEERVRQFYMSIDKTDLLVNRLNILSIRGDIALLKGLENEAMVHYREAQIISERYNFMKEQKIIYERMADLLDRVGRHKESVVYYRKLLSLNTELMRQHKNNLMVKAKTEFYLKEKELEAQQLMEKNELIRQKADYDFLTGVYSRRYITEHLERTFKRVMDSEDRMALMIFDIDNFKKINDTYGHPIGDQVIKDVSQLVQESLPEEYKMGRIGGDEFVICFENKLASEVSEFCLGLVELVEENWFSAFDGEVHLTISAGIVDTTNENSSTVHNMLYIADQALYKAKADGKNRLFLL